MPSDPNASQAVAIVVNALWGHVSNVDVARSFRSGIVLWKYKHIGLGTVGVKAEAKRNGPFFLYTIIIFLRIND